MTVHLMCISAQIHMLLVHLVQKHELQTKQYFVSLWKKKEAAEARYFLGSM